MRPVDFICSRLNARLANLFNAYLHFLSTNHYATKNCTFVLIQSACRYLAQEFHSIRSRHQVTSLHTRCIQLMPVPG